MRIIRGRYSTLPWQPVYNRIMKPLKDVNGFLPFMKSNIPGCSLGLQQNYSACHGYDKYDSKFVGIESVWTTSLQSWFAKLCNEVKRNEMSNFSGFWVLLYIWFLRLVNHKYVLTFISLRIIEYHFCIMWRVIQNSWRLPGIFANYMIVKRCISHSQFQEYGFVLQYCITMIW